MTACPAGSMWPMSTLGGRSSAVGAAVGAIGAACAAWVARGGSRIALAGGGAPRKPSTATTASGNPAAPVASQNVLRN
jgi:hypothetical protein